MVMLIALPFLTDPKARTLRFLIPGPPRTAGALNGGLMAGPVPGGCGCPCPCPGPCGLMLGQGLNGGLYRDHRVYIRVI